MIIQTISKEKNISIDVLKFFAVLLITNSHMDLLYGEYSSLATGGAIGDVLFFFCSGFTLFLGKERRFDNYYKRRINRIYPTVFMWALLSTAFFGNMNNMVDVLLCGGSWFVSCIMIYYVGLYIIRRYFFNRLISVLVLSLALSVCLFFIMNKATDYSIYGDTYFKWYHYFSFMLFGAILGRKSICHKFDFVWDFIKFICCVAVFYAILIFSNKYQGIYDLQIVSLFPLMGITFYFYKICNSDSVKILYNKTLFCLIVKIISGLCLEIYLVQTVLFTDKFNNLFPLNLLLMFVIILVVAYLLRCMARWFSQIFKEQDYEWYRIYKIYYT